MMERHDDMLGEVRSAVGGGTQWTNLSMRDTGFILGTLVNNSSGDFFQCKIQMTHRRKRNSNLDSIHLHWCCGSQAVNAGETIVWSDVRYAWIKPGEVFPANANWVNEGPVTWTLPAMAAYEYAITNLVSDIAIPAGWSGEEGYGSMLLIKATRGIGTYTNTPATAAVTGVTILDCDVHSPMDRLGSINEYSD